MIAIAWKHTHNPTRRHQGRRHGPALSFARERFAEKQASESRPCPVARRSRYRPDPSVRDPDPARLLSFSCPLGSRYRKATASVVLPRLADDRFDPAMH